MCNVFRLYWKLFQFHKKQLEFRLASKLQWMFTSSTTTKLRKLPKRVFHKSTTTQNPPDKSMRDRSFAPHQLSCRIVLIASWFFRFGLSSSESGFILSSYNIASCVVIPIVSYVGGRGNKPLWVGWGMAVMGVGCLLFASPRFIADKYEISEFNGTNEFLCSTDETIVTSTSTLSYFK